MSEQIRYRQAADNPGSSVAVGTASTPLVAANPDRFEIHVVNDSANVVYLRLAPAGATIGQGIRLNPNGGSFSSTFYNGALSAIATAAGSNVAIAEV